MSKLKHKLPAKAEKIIKKIARQTEANWRGKKYKMGAFSKIALEAITDNQPQEAISKDIIIELISSMKQVPQQLYLQPTFGEPPVTLHWNGRFVVDVYFWYKQDTAIHDHHFSGAFMVVDGESIQNDYAFKVIRDMGKIKIGERTLKKTKYFTKGSTEEIKLGPAFIHQVLHTSYPTLTFAVRTNPLNKPLSRYLLYIAAKDIKYMSRTYVKKTQVIDSLIKAGDPYSDKFIVNTLNKSDDIHAFWYSFHLHRINEYKNKLRILLSKSNKGKTTWVDPFLKSIKQAPSIHIRTSAIKNDLSRKITALITSLHGKKQLKREIEKISNGIPYEETIINWIKDLTSNKAVNFRINKTTEVILQETIKGHSERQIQQTLTKQFNIPGGSTLFKDIKECKQSLLQIPLIRKLIG